METYHKQTPSPGHKSLKRTTSMQSKRITHTAKKRRRIIASSESNDAEIDDFPHWAKGTVWVELSQDLNCHYQLHKAVLERNSTWFAEELGRTLVEPGGLRRSYLKEIVRYLFRLDPVDGSKEPLLRRTALSGEDRSTPLGVTAMTPDTASERTHDCQQTQALILLEGTKPEPGIPKTEPPAEESSQNRAPHIPTANERLREQELHQQHLSAYHSLFLIYYNRAPEVSTTNISVALSQCELLVSVATYYGSLRVVRPYLGNILSQFRHALYAAIAEDPPRWFKLSIPLESASIFSEALIHLAGCWPHWIWTTPALALSPSMIDLVKRKAKHLNDLRGEVDRELLTNSLSAEGGHPVTFSTSLESWMVVQIFRDWLATQMHNRRRADKAHHGIIYRLMRKGGESYLPLETVSEELEGLRGNGMGSWVEVAEDLKALKEFAMQAVAQLVKNNIMLDVEAARIQYLTCVEVVEEDFPWRKGP